MKLTIWSGRQIDVRYDNIQFLIRTTAMFFSRNTKISLKNSGITHYVRESKEEIEKMMKNEEFQELFNKKIT